MYNIKYKNVKNVLKSLRCLKKYGIIIQRLFCIEGEIMVKAELTYNPYLMEMNVKFNEQAPRINSLIEKYKDIPLTRFFQKEKIISK